MNNAQRPDATDYLPQSYIDTHEEKFSGDASCFTPKWALDELGRHDGQFVITKAELDDILIRTGGNMPQVEIELGMLSGDWKKVKRCY